MQQKKGQRGFSLIELLVVVAIIGTIAAIAIPHLYAARKAANESSAIASVRAVISAQNAYQTTAGQGQFGDAADLLASGHLDSLMGSDGTKSGYKFTTTANVVGGQKVSFDVKADCTSSLVGVRSFYGNETGVIYYIAGVTAPTRAQAASGVATPIN